LDNISGLSKALDTIGNIAQKEEFSSKLNGQLLIKESVAG